MLNHSQIIARFIAFRRRIVQRELDSLTISHSDFSLNMRQIRLQPHSSCRRSRLLREVNEIRLSFAAKLDTLDV